MPTPAPESRTEPERGGPRAAGWTRRVVAGCAVAAVALSLGWSVVFSGMPGFSTARTAALLVGLLLGAVCVASRRWRPRIIAAAVAVVFALALSEVALRALGAAPPRTVYRLDEQSQYGLIPSREKTFRHSAVNGGRTVTVKINSQGFRGDEIPERSAAPRAVVFGDSCIEGEFSDLPRTFVKRLESRLGPGAEVINAGVVGYGPDQELRRMEVDVPRLRPDLAVVCVFADNDFGDLVRDKLFRLDEHGQFAENRPTVASGLRAQFDLARQRLALLRLIGRILERPPALGRRAPAMTATQTLEDLLAQCTREYEEFVVDRDDSVSKLLFDHYDADVSLAPRSASRAFKVALMEQVLLRMKRVAERGGAAFALLVIPSPIDVCDHFDKATVDRAAFPQYVPTAMTDIVEGIARKHSIECLNLYPAFRAVDANSLYFHGGEDHWNDDGQDLAARLMAEFVRSRGLFPAK